MHVRMLQTPRTPCVRTPQVNDDDENWCKDRYSNCDVDSSGYNCKDGWLYKDGVCFKDHPDDTATRLTPPSPRPAPWPSSRSLRTSNDPPASFPRSLPL